MVRKKLGRGRKNRCRFCTKEGCPRPAFVDYKDVPTLKKLCTSQGKLFSRKRSGNCAAFQRAVKDAIKRARFMALLPYVGEWRGERGAERRAARRKSAGGRLPPRVPPAFVRGTRCQRRAAPGATAAPSCGLRKASPDASSVLNPAGWCNGSPGCRPSRGARFA